MNELGKTIHFVLESPGKVSENEFCRLVGTVVLHVVCFVIQRYWLAIPKVHYSKGLLFRNSTVQIRATVLALGLELGSGLVEIVDF